jgi:hypothetical protein
MISRDGFVTHGRQAIALRAGSAFVILLLIVVEGAGFPQLSHAQTAPQAAQPTPSTQTGPPAPGSPRPRGPRYVAPDPINFDDHSGWQQLFDGYTLKGWDGPTDVWTVANGMIVASSTAANPTGSTYLIWTGGEPANFEFKAEMKLEGEGSNNLTAKGAVWPRGHSSTGTRAALDESSAVAVQVIEVGLVPARVPLRVFLVRHRTDLRSTKLYATVRTAPAAGEKPSLLGTFGDQDAIRGYIDVGGWNQVHIIARGNMMTYLVNGHLMSILIDDNPTMAASKGRLALQLEGRGDVKVYFRDVWLKELP